MKIIAYNNVYERKVAHEFSFMDLIDNPEVIFEKYDKEDFISKLESIKNNPDKELRNIQKREYLPAVDLSSSGVLSIDIDNIHDQISKKVEIIDRLSRHESCLAVKESVSGNLVAFFKYECFADKFPFLYYKLYLELVLLLSVNIDFLPEIGRLRYVSVGETYYKNEQALILTEILEVPQLPYINSAVGKDKARRVVFGSN